MASDSKPDCAEFAAQRESSMLRSRKSSNPTARLVPESSKQPPSVSTGNDVHPATTEPETDESSVLMDYPTTSNSILIALKHMKGHLTWSDAEKQEAIALIGPPSNFVQSILFGIICAIIGSVMCRCAIRRT